MVAGRALPVPPARLSGRDGEGDVPLGLPPRGVRLPALTVPPVDARPPPSSHVEHVLNKLDFRSRADAVRAAASATRAWSSERHTRTAARERAAACKEV